MKLENKFYLACENGDLEVAKSLFPYIKKIDNNKNYVYFLVACLRKDFKTAEWLYEIRDKDDEDYVDEWFLDNIFK